MEYLVLLYGDPTNMPEPGTEAFETDMQGFDAFSVMAGDAIVAGEALEMAPGWTVRPDDDGTVQVTDGPFVETTEVLGGFFVLEAPTLDDCIELARHIPAVDYPGGGIEIRPMVEWQQTEEVAPPEGTEQARAMVTIHGPETASEQPGSAGWDEGVEEHGRFASTAGSHLLASGAVHPSSTATALRRRDGELLVTDGPFSEAIEIVGGFYVLGHVTGEILDLAREVPLGPDGWALVQPVMELDG